jgi:hypothetical protein
MTETKEDFFEMANLFPDDAWEPRPSPMLRSVADWIRLNEAALVDYWEYRISAVQFYPAIATLDVKRNTAAVVCTQRNGTPPGGAWKIRPRIVRSRHAKILNSSEAAKHY